jgi:hypothetical protein
MGQHVFQRERRRHVRRSGILVRVAVKDQSGQVCRGTVLNLSEEGVGLFTETLPDSEVLELQPANSTLWIPVTTKHWSSASSGFLIGCAFQSAPTQEILDALYARR